MSRTIQLRIAYDGTDYSGWQTQADTRTVQETIELALAELVGFHIRIAGSSRTDAGVHALGQVASFDFDGNIPIRAFHHGLNSLLPSDIRILNAQEMPLGFHAQNDAIEKTYHYYCVQGATINPIVGRYAHELRGTYKLELADLALKMMVGTHDFSSFCASGCDVKTKVRTVLAAQMQSQTIPHPLFQDLSVICFEVRGTGFLKHMVRNMVGTALDVAKGHLQVDAIPQILAAKDRTQAGLTAPAKGLFLVRILYQ